MGYIDLHVHTNCSDGTLTPAQVVARAIQLGLTAVAITDHDTLAGIKEAKVAAKAAKNQGVDLTVLAGVEISADYQGKDIHILGLNIEEDCSELMSALDKALQDRELRNTKMVENLRADGIDIHLSDLTFDEPDTVITRAHFARFLIEHHLAKDNADAFERYLGYHTKYYVPRSYIKPADAIRLIKEAHGVPVLAHPLLYGLTIKQVEELIAYLKELGLEGIETIYSANMNFDEGIIRRFANHYGLLMTGGSDFHGSNKPQIELGIGRGNLKIPDALLDPILKRTT